MSRRGGPWAALPALLLASLALSPSASAGSQPAIYFLKDGELGPLGPGVLDTLPPAPVYLDTNDTENLTKNEPPTFRNVVPGQELVAPVLFLDLNESLNAGRILGPIYVGLWAPQTPSMQYGDLNISLVLIGKDAPPVAAEMELLAWTSVPLDWDNSSAPDPSAFVPPDPTDPEGAVNYIAGQALAYALPALLLPRFFVLLDDGHCYTPAVCPDYIIDREIPDDKLLALRFAVTTGASPLPVPVGAGQPLQYDWGFSPSFLFVPWYAPDPDPTGTSTSRSTTSRSQTSHTGSASGDEDGGGKGKDSPGAPLLAMLALIAVATWVARRRLT